MSVAQNIEAIRERLLKEQGELQGMSHAHAPERVPVELDQQSVGRLARMDALQVQAMAIETERRRKLRLERIATALARIAEGEFGYCLTCGDEIAPARLKFDPTVPTCVKCAKQAER